MVLATPFRFLMPFRFLGYNVKISRSENEIDNADALVMPGVGAFKEAIDNIKSLNLKSILDKNALQSGKPVLGICVGMQLMASFSEENGKHDGLAWIPGEVKRITPQNLSVPHVGWNEVIARFDKDDLFSNAISETPNFYWDHGYHYDCDDKYKLAVGYYGMEITAAVKKDNYIWSSVSS